MRARHEPDMERDPDHSGRPETAKFVDDYSQARGPPRTGSVVASRPNATLRILALQGHSCLWHAALYRAAHRLYSIS